MIPQKIQALFNFIDYLDKNRREYIEVYIPLCSELKALKGKQRELRPRENYIDKQKHGEIQNQIERKFAPITLNIYSPITNKLRELKIWSGDETYASVWNNNITAISDFKENFTREDVKQVMRYKKKYLSFRSETNTNFLCLSLAFDSLDEILKTLFDFFKDVDKNEFESLEAKVIEVESVEDAVRGIKEHKGENVKFSIPTEALYNNPNKDQTSAIPNNIKNEIIMGDKIEAGNISNHDGQISFGKENNNRGSSNDDIAKKTLSWQKWGLVIGTILAIATIVVTIILSL